MAKLTLQLSPEMERVLDSLATTRGLPKSQVLRRAMLLMQFLDDQVAEDHDILLKDRATGETSRLVFESQLREQPSRAQLTGDDLGARDRVETGASSASTGSPSAGDSGAELMRENASEVGTRAEV